MLFVIGLGLGGEEDITVRGLKAVQSSDQIFLEHYTSILGVSKEKLEQFYGKKIILADRDMVESQSDLILNDARDKNVSFLVVGDPYA
jgi:diphthine methyl ester synthase